MTDTTDLVARLEGLLAKASPPPWTSRVVPITYPECDDADLPAVVFNADGKEVTCLPERYWGPSNQHEDDAALIAEAITALPALLAAVREGEAEVERLRKLGGEMTGSLNFILAFYDPGQTYLDTNAWKNAEASGRRSLASGKAEFWSQSSPPTHTNTEGSNGS